MRLMIDGEGEQKASMEIKGEDVNFFRFEWISRLTQSNDRLHQMGEKSFVTSCICRTVDEGEKENKSLSIYLLNFLTAPISTQPRFTNTKILLSSPPMQTLSSTRLKIC